MTDLQAQRIREAHLSGLKMKCPRCDKGPLMKGALTVRDECPNCKLDYSFVDSADGPAFFVMIVAGFVVCAAALYVEFTYLPPLWVHVLIWLPVSILVSIAMLRPLKGWMIAMQYVHNAREGEVVRADEDKQGSGDGN